MRFVFIICSLLLLATGIAAQSITGITNIPDTSFTINSEYVKLVKSYPGLKIVTEIPNPNVFTQKDIAYTKAGNRELLMNAFYPAQNFHQKRTAIIILHGGGWRSGNRNLHYPLAQQLAALGYVCFTPEYRLSTEALFPAAVYDCKAAVRWVRKHAKEYNIDVNKIVIAGHSSGGELAAFTGSTNNNLSFEGNGNNRKISSRVNAVIDIDGLLAFIHPESGEGDDSKKTSAATYWFGYSKTENPELWKDASPLTHADQNSPPILFINSSVDRMHAGREDFISKLNNYNIYTAVKTFEGSPHSFVFFNFWFDSTIMYMDNFLYKIFENPAHPIVKKIIVASDGTGDYTSVQAAFDAVPLQNKKPVTIFIKKGSYKEKLRLDSTKNFITIKGEDKFNTILTYDDHTGKTTSNGDTINTRTSWSFLINADNFTATDITFQNDAGFSAGQAVAVESDGDKTAFKNCRFIGNQDVLFTNNENSRQYYENCYIEGTTDFIFGSSTVWFENCHIHSKKNSHITAAATPKENEFGYVFNNCRLTGDTSLHNVSLGRPWRPYANTIYMNTYMGVHIKAEGWSNWNNTDNYKTTRYSEYKNYGPSSTTNARVNWSKQLSDEEAKRITLKKVMKDWNPQQ